MSDQKPPNMTDEQLAEYIRQRKQEEFDPNAPLPPSTGVAPLARVTGDGRALARRAAGEIPPNELRFHCGSCGQDKQLQFDEDEIAALGGDIREYTGPCWNCGTMMLRPYNDYWGKDFPSMSDMASKARREEYREQAQVFADTIADKAASMLVPKPSPAATADAAPAPADAPEDDLPEDVDVSELKPR